MASLSIVPLPLPSLSRPLPSLLTLLSAHCFVIVTTGFEAPCLRLWLLRLVGCFVQCAFQCPSGSCLSMLYQVCWSHFDYLYFPEVEPQQ